MANISKRGISTNRLYRYTVALTMAIVTLFVPIQSFSRTVATIEDFEIWGKNTWRIGDEKYGSFEQSTEQVKDGHFSGKLTYQFPATIKNYVIFRHVPALKIAGSTQSLEIWVYGDGSTNFLNVWIQDAANQIWQFSFGRIEQFGNWSKMVARLDTNMPWPTTLISGGNGSQSLTYPLRLYALVLDGWNETTTLSGTIFVDALAITTSPIPTVIPTPIPTVVPIATSKPTSIEFYADRTSLNYGECTTLRWKVQHVNGYYLNDAPMTGDSGQLNVCPVFPQQSYSMKILTDSGDQYRTVTISVAQPTRTPLPPKLCKGMMSEDTDAINYFSDQFLPIVDYGRIKHYTDHTHLFEKDVAFTNCGDSPLVFYEMNFVDGVGREYGPNYSIFRKEELYGKVLQPGESCWETIVFESRGSSGTRWTVLDIRTNASQEWSSISLKGESVDIGPAPKVVSFGQPLIISSKIVECRKLKN